MSRSIFFCNSKMASTNNTPMLKDLANLYGDFLQIADEIRALKSVLQVIDVDLTKKMELTLELNALEENIKTKPLHYIKRMIPLILDIYQEEASLQKRLDDNEVKLNA